MIKKNSILLAVSFFLLSVSLLSANGQSEAEEKVTLKFVTWDNILYDYMIVENPISELYTQTHPNVEIEIEKSKDSESFEQTMQIRAAAGELPDILPLKPYMLEKYKDLMLSLNDHPSVSENKFAELYAIDDSIIGLPIASFNEFVYYRKSIFKELGLSIPKTWGEYIDLLVSIKENGKYTPLAMGLKDAWPVYPFNEYMPLLESGTGNYYNEMATMDAPFTKGKPFYKTYSRIQDMMDLDIMGSDPLGLGWDQAKTQFAAGEAVLLAAGQWFISDFTDSLGGDVNDLGIFFLPVRDSISEPQYATVMADTFLGIPKDGKNIDASKEFIQWFFDEYYEQILPSLGVSSVVEGLEVSGNPVLEQVAQLDQPEFILVEADGADFTGIKNNIQFDVKKIGQEMASGYYDSFDVLMQKLNELWADAK